MIKVEGGVANNENVVYITLYESDVFVIRLNFLPSAIVLETNIPNHGSAVFPIDQKREVIKYSERVLEHAVLELEKEEAHYFSHSALSVYK